MIYCRCSIHKHIVQNESTRGKTKIILLTLEMARQEVSRTTHIEEVSKVYQDSTLAAEKYNQAKPIGLEKISLVYYLQGQSESGLIKLP